MSIHMSIDTMPRLPFVHRYINRLPIFFSWDSIYSRQTKTRRDALNTVVRHPEIVNASWANWTGAMIE